MKNKVLLQANFKRHRGTMIGIYVIMLLVSLSLISVVSIWLNANLYLDEELDRMHYGDLSVWTESIPDAQALYDQINQLPDVEHSYIQQLIYADYEIFDQHSDSEGQLIVYDPEMFPYRIFLEHNDGYERDAITISPGEIYLSPTVLAAMKIQIGDWITFPIDRNGNQKIFKIKGTFEDPFMGSSMIGMKSFLISQEDYDEISKKIETAGIDAIARTGQMIHINQSSQSSLTIAQFNQLLNEQTSLGQYVEFIHSKAAITSFMLVLQNVFAGCSLAFSLILMIVSFIIISYSIGTTIEQDQKNLGILKSVGYEGRTLRSLLKQQYLFVIVLGLVSGVGLSLISVPFISRSMLSFAGLLTPSTPHVFLWIILLMIAIVFFYWFLHIKTKKLEIIPPVYSIQEEAGNLKEIRRNLLGKRWLLTRLSLRQLIQRKRRYISICMTAMLLVWMISLIGRMNSWLGADGQGMMDAFHPADLDIGVQLIGNQSVEEMERIIQQQVDMIDSYELAMPGVSINGIDVTANVISEPDRFHIHQGSTSQAMNEIVVTETIASDMDLNIGDSVKISYLGKSASYTVSGIYQCANDMGTNIGMSKEGFLQIGEDTQDLWCHHYFLNQPEQKQTIIDTLNNHYGGDVYIHENTWPGLFSMITTMKVLLIVMYSMSAFFILLVTIMTAYKIFLFEKKNLSIYKALGFTSMQLRATFAIRYGVMAGIGSFGGVILSSFLTDGIVGALMKHFGISNFVSHPDLMIILLPGIVVSLLFACFAYLTSGKIVRLDMNELVSE